MSVYRRLAAAGCVIGLVFLMSGCTGGVTAQVEYTFDEGTSFTQSVDLKGAALDDSGVSALKSAGWTVKSRSTGFSATHSFKDAAEYTQPAGTLYNTLSNGFVNSAGYDPDINTEVTVRRVVTDYFLAERHDVEVVMPMLDFVPSECPSCGGTGSSDCEDCIGGTTVCSACNGTGGYNGWYGWEDCYECGGSGDETCNTCDGRGVVDCYDCDGTGDTPEFIQTRYDEAVSASRLDVVLNMPGITVKDNAAGTNPWKFKGADIEDAESFTATSFVVNWLYAGIALAVLLLILALIVGLIVRRIKKAFRKKSPAVVASQPVVAQSVVAQPMAEQPVVPACASCGSTVAADAKFCRACGTPRTNGDA